jgi:HlyD family secretion protein
VKEGETVQKGQVLLRLNTDLSSKRKADLEQAIQLKRQERQEKGSERSSFLQQNSKQLDVLSRNLKLQQEILNRLERLERQGASAELQVLQQRNKVEETSGQLANAQLERGRQLAVYQQQIQQLEGQLTELSSRLKEQQMTLRYQELRAPVAGMVFDLKPTGKGYVLGEGSTVVLKLVPFEQLQADVEIPSRQIGFIRAGQQADISIDSFPAADFGVLQGTVSRIGSDALPPDPQQNKQEFRYPATIRLASQQLTLKNGQQLRLQSGMSLVAHVKLRKASYLQLLLGSFREKSDALRSL